MYKGMLRHLRIESTAPGFLAVCWNLSPTQRLAMLAVTCGAEAANFRKGN